MNLDISVLCIAKNSNYKLIEGLDLWDIERDAYNYSGSNRVIAHPPCQQWSRLKSFAKVDAKSKDLAFFCLDKVRQNGGVLEHPHGSSFFKAAGIKPTLSVDQFWFGFPARKRTWLYFHGFTPAPVQLRFDAIERTVPQLGKVARSETTIRFAEWLIKSIT
jgi:hypothetical protein